MFVTFNKNNKLWLIALLAIFFCSSCSSFFASDNEQNLNNLTMLEDNTKTKSKFYTESKITTYADLTNDRELKLKMRELAAQLAENIHPKFKNTVAIPTSFVQQDNFKNTSSFGRFAVEQMYYEFNLRGLNTQEYRLASTLEVNQDGEFMLSRALQSKQLSNNKIYLVGTYYSTGHSIFVNARLIRNTGEIVSVGQAIVPAGIVNKQMLASPSHALKESAIQIKDFDAEARPDAIITDFDLGLDIH